MSKLKIEEIDTEVWYELYDGNGATFTDRLEFVKNSKRVLKGLRNGAKIKSVFDDTKYSELDTKRQHQNQRQNQKQKQLNQEHPLLLMKCPHLKILFSAINSSNEK